MMRRAVGERGAQRRVHAHPEGAGVAVRARTDPTKLRRLLGGGGLESRGQPHAPSQEVNVHLQKGMAGAGDGQLEEVEADATAATRGDRQGYGAEKVTACPSPVLSERWMDCN